MGPPRSRQKDPNTGVGLTALTGQEATVRSAFLVFFFYTLMNTGEVEVVLHLSLYSSTQGTHVGSRVRESQHERFRVTSP